MDEGAISNSQTQNVNLGLHASAALPADEQKIIAGTSLLARGKLLKHMTLSRVGLAPES